MDQNEKQKLQTSIQSNKYRQFLMKTMQFLLSVSVLSFLLSYSSAISNFFHYFSFRFSTLLFSQTLERKYIFLICNGIVAVLVKNLNFTSSSPPGSDLRDVFAKTDQEDGMKPVLEMEAPVEDEETSVACIEEEQENGSLNIKQEGDSRALITVTDDDEEEEEEKDSGSLIPPLSAEDEGNEVNVSTEELNRKFDEFIRKMKEEIRIEAQQQLIAA
ncbi:hypothetical protein LOK49_LG09G00060 [Camellia lanceoleosa]|uniref:Uncharacterized protein n=1 Tax=Camellia lanceoleosa TaxID=1840588 RepID=A0ACC0GKC4_9ERIC|nr:hypothetical protein LOK49_LG09G00060 [Camellia lanceoleosa]